MDVKIYWNSAAVILLTLLSLISWCYAECPTNFLRLHNKCYYFSTDKVQWFDAHFRCKDLKANLLLVNNRNQDNKLKHYLQSGYLATNEWWLGARYDWKQKVWTWSKSGQPLIYNQFQHKHKNNEPSEWHCGTIDPKINYKWSSRQCTDKLHFVCQSKMIGNSTDENLNNDIPVIISPHYLNKTLTKSDQDKNTQPGYIISRPVKTKTNNSLKPRMFCPNGYRHVRGTCYRFSKNMASWQDAYYICDAEHNGTLAIIRNKKEDSAIRRASARLQVTHYDRWIGGRYDWEDASWKWATSGVVIQHQSMDREKLRWHCLVWSLKFKDKWTSDVCVKEKHFICQTAGKWVTFPDDWNVVRPYQKSLTPLEYQLGLRYKRPRQ